MPDSQRLIDPSDLRKYRHELPNLIDDMGLSPFAYRLYGHIKRRCGASDGGVCYEGTRSIAEHCKMSAGMVFKAKRELEAAGLIKIVPGNAKTNTADSITVVDVWAENFRRYQTCSQDEQGIHGMNRPVHESAQTCSPDEHKKEPKQERTIEEENAGECARATGAPPDWLDPEVWKRWLAFRREINHPVKATQAEGQFKKLEQFRARGMPPEAVLEQSIANGWQGLFSVKELENGNGTRKATAARSAGRTSYNERTNDALRELYDLE